MEVGATASIRTKRSCRMSVILVADALFCWQLAGVVDDPGYCLYIAGICLRRKDAPCKASLTQPRFLLTRIVHIFPAIRGWRESDSIAFFAIAPSIRWGQNVQVSAHTWRMV